MGRTGRLTGQQSHYSRFRSRAASMNERRLVAVGHSKAALPISPTPARLGRVGSAPMQVIQPSESDMQARVVYAIARQDGKPLAFAGIWETFRWPDETVHRSVGIMTTRPNAEMDELHDRMPVILEEQDWPVWLAELDGDHGALLRPAPDGTLQAWPVDRRVGRRGIMDAGSSRRVGRFSAAKRYDGTCRSAR